jgi:voltage-gated potassium channel
MKTRARRLVFQIIEAGYPEDWKSRSFDYVMVALIMANVAAVALETVDFLWVSYGTYFEIFDVISVAIFTVEYVARLWVSTEHRQPGSRVSDLKARFQYALTPYALVDLFAILPFYLQFYVAVDLRILRVFRLLRMLKLVRYSPALDTLVAVIVAERRALTAALVVMMVMLVCSASVMYHLERHAQPESFGSIPAAMWWATVTLTTVGYGDVTPITVAGKIFGGMVTVLGLAMYALPIGIMASGFVNEIRQHDFAVTWGMVAKVPAFADLDARSIAQIAGLLHARMVTAGEVIIEKGRRADCMYFIVSGEVEVLTSPKPVTLGVDDFFGELGLLMRAEQAATIRALTDCQLMLLDERHFHRLLQEKPLLREKIMHIAEERGAFNTSP